ncbi:WD repeat domain-containing protein [Phlyctema vagabunda]|uniref:WD repeat domain-containing protein n=1 Tax=Phlyctema vagabunda TaxID=108571 RepID=A0ABR4PJA8_9HELO
MADTLPKIRVTDAQNLDGSTLGASVSPSTVEGGSGRPLSATSSEGNANANAKKSQVSQIRHTSSSKETSNGAGVKPSSPPPTRSSTAIDPLSHHILKRTNTESTIPQKLRTTALPESPVAEVGSPVSADTGTPVRNVPPEIIRSDSNPSKDKKKGVSFLSRFSIIGGKKKDMLDDFDDDESEAGDVRPEGMNAHVFSSSIGANGYIPQHKEPPRYIKVRAHHKKIREFNRMFLAQELSGTKQPQPTTGDKVPGLTAEEVQPNKLTKPPKASEAVWSVEFSRDGKYLAAAGRDQVVRVWAVISTPEERQAHEHDEDVSSATVGGERLSAPVFRSKPIREFLGHTGEILDLSWSKNNFLLSSSMDKTVRLWHISRQECLCTFKHKDFVTAIAFHPRDDRFFLAGSLDSVLRLWSIPDKSVAFWNQLPDLITAVAFTPDGKTAMAGVLSGLCLFYETEGLKYTTQIHVRSSRGKNAKGSKVTGIRCMTLPSGSADSEGETKVLITSNDSRVRMYNLRDKALEMKFRGNENTCSQINASFSDDAHYVVCGSEDRKAYIWSTCAAESENKDKRPVEYFEAHSEMVTATAVAPTSSRQLLSASGDPLYDLCNPPPVTLLSREESNASSIPPVDPTKRHSDPTNEKPEVSPAYLARCTHADGNIIITADYLGNIKVFRQDCAFQKRRNDHWETGSNFSKKMLGRSGSIMTRHSAGSHSRRTSISQASNSIPSVSQDQILSWRNSVRSNDSRENSLRGGFRETRVDRSISPGKPNLPSQALPAPAASQSSLAQSSVLSSGASRSVPATSPPQSLRKTSAGGQPPLPSFSLHSANDDNPLKLDSTGKSYQFWNPQSWKNPLNAGDSSKAGSEGLKPLKSRGSVVSKLSSEENSASELGDESEGESLTCKKCSGKEFRTKKLVGRGQRVVCTRCGTVAE